MNRSHLNSRGLALVGIAALALSACGGSDSLTRNAEGDMVACVNQAQSAITAAGELELHFCEGATQWVREDEGATYSEKMPITDAKATTSLSAFGSMKVLSYDAQGNTVGIDKITLNGSRGGLTFKIDTSKKPIVFSEVARAGWSGEDKDPNVEHDVALEIITKFNNSFAPAGDWYLPSRSELTTLFEQESLVKSTAIDVSGLGSAYWLSDKIDAARFGVDGIVNGALRSVSAPGGFAYWQRQAGPGTNEFARPIRTYTNGDGPVILVAAGFSPTTPSSSSEPIVNTPQPTLTTPTTNLVPPTSVEPEQITRINVISISKQDVVIPAGQQTIKILPIDVKENVTDVSPTPIEKTEIQFDNGAWIAISLSETTAITIPADAKTAVVRVTSTSGDSYLVTKAINREGNDVTTTTEAPSRAPTVAAPVSGDSGNSNSNTLYVVLVLSALLIVAAVLVFRRRSSSSK